MGPSAAEVAVALSGSVPIGAPLYTAEEKHLLPFERAAQDRRSELFVVRPDQSSSQVSEEELAEFRYIEHAENVALALRICADLGVSRAIALAGMQAARPDPGALTISEHVGESGRFWLVNGFAANDPESSELVWEMSKKRVARAKKYVALVNCRSDRAERSAQLGEVCMRWSPADHYLLCGSGTHFFKSAATRAGLDPMKVVSVEEDSAEVLSRRLSHLAGEDGLVVGLGNIGGIGLALMRTLSGRVA
jgi:poly-gamma-glutamate synthase PgsB/CapB